MFHHAHLVVLFVCVMFILYKKKSCTKTACLLEYSVFPRLNSERFVELYEAVIVAGYQIKMNVVPCSVQLECARYFDYVLFNG